MLLKVILVKNVSLVIIGFFIYGFKFQDSVCKGCYDLTMLCLNVSNITIITVKCVDCPCIIHDISKFEVIRLLEVSVLEDRGYI